MQPVVKDGLKEAKALKIISFICKSIPASNVLEGEKKLQATQWNSENISVQSLLQVSEEKLCEIDVAVLTTYDRKLLSELVTILLHFRKLLISHRAKT